MNTIARAAFVLLCGLLGFIAGTYVKYSAMARMPSFGEYVTIVSAGRIDRGFFAPDLKVAGAETVSREAVDSLVKASPDLSRQDAFFTLVRRNGIRIGFRRLLWSGALGFLAASVIAVASLLWWTRRVRSLGDAAPQDDPLNLRPDWYKRK